MALYRQMTIVGVGLLGGSLARAARDRRLVDRLIGQGRTEATLRRAEAQGVIDAGFTDIRQAVQGSDLVVLCSPVGTFRPRVEEMREALSPGAHLTDVGSVKGGLVRELESLMPPGVAYVGAHPIAGSEQSGLDASCGDLFQGARCIVTPTERTDAAALKKITALWEGVGLQVVSMDPDEHDLILGAVSHLPHAVAFALMNTVAEVRTPHYGDVLEFSGGGLRDITRIASSDPVMWRDLCLANREALLKILDDFRADLDRVRSAIERGNGEWLRDTFAAAKRARDDYSA